MLYQRPSFQLPASKPGTSQKDWDRAFLSKDEFEAKYPRVEYHTSDLPATLPLHCGSTLVVK